MKSIRLKASVAMLAVATLAFSTQAGDDLTWSGDSGNYSAPANWTSDGDLTGYTSIFDWKTDAPGKNIRFGGAAAGKTVTMDIWDNRVWNCWFYNGATPVTFAAADTTTGFEAYWGFHICAAANDVAALTVINGLYTTPSVENTDNASSWGTGDNAKFTLNLAGGKIDLWGHKGTDGLYLTHGKGVASTINITDGTLAVANDIAIGNADTDDTSSTTISISNGGSLSCGTATVSKWLKFPAAGTGKTTINLNAGGTLALWHIRHISAGECALNFNGGTLKVLGNIGYGLLGYDNNTDASTMAVTLQENGGIIDTDFNTSLNNPVSGSGSLTKKGTGRLTFNDMPVFTGTLTVAEGAGSVILPTGATIAAGAGTDRRTLTDGTVEYFHGSVSSSSTLFTEGADATITLAGDTYLDIDATVAIGKLTITGSGNLHLSGSAVVTATSLDIVSGATVQLASGTNLATGPLQTTSVTGAGTIVYDAVPDGTASDLKPDEAGYTQDTWTGTVWIQNCIYRTATGTLWTDPAAYGNARSTVKFTNAKIYLKESVVCDATVELANVDASGVAHEFALQLTNGSGNKINTFAKLTGDGTFTTGGTGGAAEILSIKDVSGFSGVFNLASRIVVIGDMDGSVAPTYVGYSHLGTVVIPEGVTVSVPADKTWSLDYGFVGAGTLKYTHPWQVGEKSLSTSEDWVGTTELAACENAGTSGVIVYPQRMGGVNSTVVFKGLGPKDGDTATYASYWIDTKTIDTTLRLDGDITLYGNGYSGATNPTTVKKLTGSGNFTLLTALSDVTYYDVTLDGYTGMLAAKPGQDCIRVAMIATDSPVGGEKLAAVDETLNNVTTLGYVIVNGESHPVTAALQSGADGYGLYVAAVQRNVYWIGGASGSWSEAGNWALADGTVLTAAPGSAAADSVANAGDNVVFTNAATVVVDSRPVITKMTLNADVVLSTTDAFKDNTYSGMKYLFVETVEGTGTLTMADAVIAAIGSGRPFKIYTPVCIADGTTNTFGCSTFMNYLYGDLSGSGVVKVGSGNYGGLSLHGNNAAFAGTFDASQTTRNNTSFYYGNATSAKAIWKLRGNDQNINTYSFIRDSGTYSFGALQEGSLLQTAYTRPTIEVGARDEVASSATLNGRGSDSSGNNYYFNITKVGANVFTVIDGNADFKANYGNLLIKGGVLEFPCVPKYASFVTFAGAGATLRPTAEGLDFSALIKNSTSAICIDDNGQLATWASALAASNVGGLTKKGAGTLTLTAAPLYSGPTVVEAGTLVVPAGTKLSTLAGQGTVVVDLANTEATGVLFAVGRNDGVTVDVRNVPEGAMRVETDAGLIYYVGTPRTYTWVGPSSAGTGEDAVEDYSWTTLSNWIVDDATPEVAPTVLDTVVFGGADAAVTIDAAAAAYAIQAYGNLTITANDALDVTADVSVEGTLTKWGSATVTANGGISALAFKVEFGAVVTSTTGDATTLNLDSQNTSAYAVDDAASYNGYGARYAVDTAGTLTLSGHGQIVANGDQTVNVAQDETTSFTGFMSGAMSLKKTGAGTLAIFGNNTFTGDVTIDAGTLKLNNPTDLEDIRYDFDASDESFFSYDGNGVLRWQDAAHPNNANAYAWNDSTNPDFVEGDSAIFNGKKVLYSDSFRMIEPATANSAGNPKTAFFVVQNTAGTTINIAGDRNDSRWNIRYRNYGYMAGYGTGGSTIWNSNGIWGNGALATQGDNGGITIGSSPAVLTFMNDCSDLYCWFDTRSTRQIYFGGSGKQAWAEYLSYTRELSFDEKAAVEQYLMAKWGIAGEYTALPKTANVTMKAGTTLDLGGMTQTVKSFAGAGTVRNGALKTATGVVTATGVLTVPAVAGQTYVMAAGNLTLTGDETAKGVFIQVPDGAKAVGRLIVPHGWTVGADAACDVVVTDLPKNWNVRPQREGDDTDQWFIGPNAFVLHLR